MFQRYLQDLATLLDIPYTVYVKTRATDDAYLSIDLDQFGRRMATVYVHPPFFELDEDERRIVCVHELGHVVYRGLGVDLDQEEDICDRYAVSLAPLLPPLPAELIEDEGPWVADEEPEE